MKVIKHSTTAAVYRHTVQQINHQYKCYFLISIQTVHVSNGIQKECILPVLASFTT